MFDLSALVNQLEAMMVNGINMLLSGLSSFVDGVLAGLVAVPLSIVNGLPNAGDLGLSSVSGIIIGYSWLDTFLPVHELLAMLGVGITVATAVFAIRLVKWSVSWIPTMSD
jgi:hypothetical protein